MPHRPRLARAVVPAILAAAAVSAPVPVLSRTSLDVASALPRTVDMTRSFLKNFVRPFNHAKDGTVGLRYIGGAAPTRKAWSALKHGRFDMLHGPADIYVATVPEAYALTLSRKSPAELRANGAFALMQKAWASKAGAWLLAWGESETRHNVYLTKRPSRTPDGQITFKGLRMRVTETFRPLFVALSAQTLGLKPPEIAQALRQGTVDGFGWPEAGLRDLGVVGAVKFRIEPAFYRSNMVVTVNLEAWNKLAKEAKEALERQAVRYERDSVAFMGALADEDEKALTDGGMRALRLEGEAARHYLEAANTAVWRVLKKHSPIADNLRKLAFPDLAS